MEGGGSKTLEIMHSSLLSFPAQFEFMSGIKRVK